MRVLLVQIAVLLGSFATGWAQANSAKFGTVTGHITCADTRTPCRFAGVTIQSVSVKNTETTEEKVKHSYAGSTDLQGAFLIDKVSPGDYYLLAHLPGYVSTYSLTVSTFDGSPELLSQALGVALQKVTVEVGKTTVADSTLYRGASISGTVQFDDGGLAMGLPMRLFRKDSQGNWKPYPKEGDAGLASIGLGSRTDDHGKFYEPGLPPGQYAVRVTLPQMMLIPQGLGEDAFDFVTRPGDALQVFNGNKHHLRDAPAIEVQEAEEKAGADITISTSRLRTLRGTVVAENHPHLEGSARLLDPVDKTVQREATIDDDGSFQFNYVPDDSYTLQIEAKSVVDSGQTPVVYLPVSNKLLVEGDMDGLSYKLPVPPLK